jgi:Xaa-Pro aminopeptidase
MNPDIQAQPPGPEDFTCRVERLREQMARAQVGGAFLTPSPNLTYFTGYEAVQTDRLLALLVPLEGPSGLVVPSFEAPQFAGLPGSHEILAWQEHEDPHALGLRFFEGNTGKWPCIALEPSMAFETAWRLMECGIGRFTLEPGTALYEAFRRRKEPLELQIMAAAAGMTHATLEKTWSRVEAGMSELEIASLLKSEFDRVNPGGTGWGLVQIGPSSALPHGAPGERRLEEGDVLLIDCGTPLHGYNSDITRTVVYGKAAERFRRIYEIVFQAQEAGIETLAPGVPCEEADRAARRVIEKAGFGAYFNHRLGHGIGLRGHESPYLVEGNQTTLVDGDAVTVEPGIYIPGEFGVRIEDVYTVTRDGRAVVGDRPTGLREIG